MTGPTHPTDADRPVRVLVVDDSATARHVLRELCEADPGVEVIGEANDGDEAVRRVAELGPDIVVMDIVMPRLDGYDATRQIMTDTPTPVVLVSANADTASPDVGRRALEVGAVTVVPKPDGHGPAAVAFVAKVRALADVKVIRHHRRRERAVAESSAMPATRARLIAVAASTGGPAALKGFLGALPTGLCAPVVVVQHIVDGFTVGLASWLDQHAALPVAVAVDGQRLVPGHVYLAPDDRHLLVTRHGTIALGDSPPVSGFRPSATELFRSTAAAYGSRVAAVVLTGMGGDGLEGVRDVRAAGGAVLAQDEATSVVYGMPAVVIAEGLAHLVGPVHRLAGAAARLCEGGQP